MNKDEQKRQHALNEKSGSNESIELFIPLVANSTPKMPSSIESDEFNEIEDQLFDQPTLNLTISDVSVSEDENVVRVVSVLDKEHKVQVDDVHKNETVVETWRIWCKIILDEAFPQTHEMDEVEQCMR